MAHPVLCPECGIHEQRVLDCPLGEKRLSDSTSPAVLSWDRTAHCSADRPPVPTAMLVLRKGIFFASHYIMMPCRGKLRVVVLVTECLPNASATEL